MNIIWIKFQSYRPIYDIHLYICVSITLSRLHRVGIFVLCSNLFHNIIFLTCSVKATVENPRGSVEKLSPNESIKDGITALRGIFRGQTRGCKTEGVQSLRFCSRGFARGKSRGSPPTAAPQHSVGTRGSLLRGQLFHSAPRIFSSCSDFQIHEVYWQMKIVFTLYYSTVWPLTMYVWT